MSTLWMYRLKVSERLALRVFLAPVEALLAALAVFLLGAALAMVTRCAGGKCWGRGRAAALWGARAKFGVGRQKAGVQTSGPRSRAAARVTARSFAGAEMME